MHQIFRAGVLLVVLSACSVAEPSGSGASQAAANITDEAAVVPAGFQGRWNYSIRDCDDAGSETNLIVLERQIVDRLGTSDIDSITDLDDKTVRVDIPGSLYILHNPAENGEHLVVQNDRRAIAGEFVRCGS